MHGVNFDMVSTKEKSKLAIRNADDADIGRHRAELASTLSKIASVALFALVCAYTVYFTGASGQCCGFGLTECESRAAFHQGTCLVLHAIFHMSLFAIIGLFITATAVTVSTES